jgi:hypothetical protein
MSSYDPFGYLKHEGSRVKLLIWLPTTKSRESPLFTCMQVTCHICLEIFWQGVRLCFKPHFNRRSTQEVMSFQSCRNPNFKNFGTPNLGVPGQNDIWIQALWLGTNITKGGRWWFPPSLGHGESCEFMFICAPKVFQQRTNQLVVWFVQVRANNWPTYHSS